MKKRVFAVIGFSLFAPLALIAMSKRPDDMFTDDNVVEENFQYENGYIENPIDELEITTLEPKSKKSLANEKDTAIRIECNVKNARIYLNKNYQGYSNLTIKDLRPGRYKLEVQKSGYKSQVYFIQVKAKLEQEYFVALEEATQEQLNAEENQSAPTEVEAEIEVEKEIIIDTESSIDMTDDVTPDDAEDEVE